MIEVGVRALARAFMVGCKVTVHVRGVPTVGKIKAVHTFRMTSENHRQSFLDTDGSVLYLTIPGAPTKLYAQSLGGDVLLEYAEIELLDRTLRPYYAESMRAHSTDAFEIMTEEAQR